jgi:hypothetical protein
MYEYLTDTMHVATDEAMILAKQFSSNLDSLIEYGAAMDAASAQQEAAYDSIASSA